MTEDHERRISTVEANYENLTGSMQRVEGYFEKLFNQQGEIKTSVALVMQSQQGMKEYQKECDDQREDHKERITALEGFQGRLVKYALIIMSSGSFITPQLSKLWEKLFS